MNRFSVMVVFVVALASACSMYKTIGKDGLFQLMTPIVKKQAAFDLACTEDQIQVVQLAEVSFGATGCGKRASYVPESPYCKADQFETRAKDICTTVVASVTSSNISPAPTPAKP